MTKARPYGLPQRDTGKSKLPATGEVKVGKYTYVTGSSRSVLEPCGILREDRTRVEPQVTESLLRDFLALLEAAQKELNQRWNDQEKSGCHADCA
jgi:hypothetical protein